MIVYYQLSLFNSLLANLKKNSVLVKLYICFCFNEVVGNSKYLLVYDVSAAVICKMGCSFPSVVFSKITCFYFIKYNLLYFKSASISRNYFSQEKKYFSTKSTGFRCTHEPLILKSFDCILPHLLDSASLPTNAILLLKRSKTKLTFLGKESLPLTGLVQ